MKRVNGDYHNGIICSTSPRDKSDVSNDTNTKSAGDGASTPRLNNALQYSIILNITLIKRLLYAAPNSRLAMALEEFESSSLPMKYGNNTGNYPFFLFINQLSMLQVNS